MKRETLLTVTIVIGSFFAGIVLAIALQSPSQLEPLSVVTNTKDDLLGTPLPHFILGDISGLLHDVSEWQDKVLVINFWATWCPPCLEEIPHFIHLQDQYGPQGVQFLGITPEEVNDVVVFANKLGINYPLLVGGPEVIKLANTLGNRIGGLPYTVIVDRNGTINFIQQGQLSFLEAEQAITPLL